MFQNTASFPKIAKGNSTVLRKLVINDILQTTGIEIDEEGSIAYAATGPYYNLIITKVNIYFSMQMS